MSAQGSRNELADFLKTRRARIAPDEAGLAVGRRRSRGLRREEVASRAGVGLTWYTRLEQGKPIQVSTAFLENLARALKLDAAERAHLFVLAQHRPPPIAGAAITAQASATLQSMLDAIATPAYARNGRFDVLAWNAANTQMFGDFTRIPAEERNVLWLMFTRTYFRRTMPSWEDDARTVLASFRMNFAAASGDPEFTALVARLNAASPVFRGMWPEHDVGQVGEGLTRFSAPRHGRELTFRHHILMPEAFPDLRITIYVPV